MALTPETPRISLKTDDPAAVTHDVARLSETSFRRTWDNDEDVAYDKL